jgi:hypothetical protein
VQLLRQHHDAEWELLSVRELREHERVLVGMKVVGPQFVVCVGNKHYPASLELRKVYRLLKDEHASRHRQVRVIDESGEDYLYPEEYFIPIKLPQAAETAVLKAI